MRARSRWFELCRIAWRLLPEPLRKTPVFQPVKRAGVRLFGRSGAISAHASSDSRAIPAAAEGPRVVESVAELDAIMRQLEAAERVSDDELRRCFQTFQMKVPTDLPADPDSAEYRSRQFQLYAQLRGKPYDVADEASDFDPVLAAERPFPYQTGSSQTVGGQLMAIGHLIRAADLP